MRRFIRSMLGSAICSGAIAALLIPSFSLLTSGQSIAQVQTQPSWAVVDFISKDKAIGKAAAEAMQSALGKTPGIDVLPKETVDRTVTTLALQQPVTDATSLMRLGAELGAGTIVRGEVVNYRIVSTGGGKRADVLFRVIVMDVASGLGINGAALQASSSVRTGDAEDMTVINEALASASAKAVMEIKAKALPTATILNTVDKDALINHGTRTGFKVGMELVVTRGRDQVGVARVTDIEPDSGTVHIERSIKGIQPGDRVRAIFDVPEIKKDFSDNGQVRTIGRTSKRGGGDFGTLAALLLVGAVLFGSGHGSGFTGAGNVEARATLFPDFSGIPAVKVTWKRDSFVRGNNTVVQWQLHRSDVLGSPVMVIPASFSTATDDNLARDVTYGSFTGVGDTGTCVDSMTTATATGVLGVVPGRPYTYQLELVYKIAAIDYPGGGTNGGYCYFVSKLTNANGIATPLDRASLVSPAPNAVISTDIPFSFVSVVNPTFPITVEYALQISPDPNFPKNRSKVYARVIRTDTGTLSSGNISNLLARLHADFGASTTEFFWRIGARNVADKPGPAPDPSGEAYVFGNNRRFTLPSAPPPPP